MSVRPWSRGHTFGTRYIAVLAQAYIDKSYTQSLQIAADKVKILVLWSTHSRADNLSQIPFDKFKGIFVISIVMNL